MVPNEWREHRRNEDDELIGYVAGCDGEYAAYTLFGYPLAEGVDEFDAEAAIEAAGLRYLAERWLLTIDGRDEPIAVEIVEAGPATVTVKNVDLGYEADWGTPFRLDVPVSPDRLRPVLRLSGRP
ncbi:hypothetical protein [Solicola gregarius]|uniref:Uncharacterized protein n=1 Tax=Solicola gregarius TaxID=2908642 RepID=A0AA46TJY9_9ACTN|nr:hypothetical protein [Solicola gregarius]UYM06485.1 hypothetical protein L0C25_05270 [Solicola gregarius]